MIDLAPRPLGYAFVLGCLCVSIAGCESPSTPNLVPPAGMILFIGDGMGQGAHEALRTTGVAIAMETLPVRAKVLTSSASHDITDSGAAATAYATGVSTFNGAIGVDVDSIPIETVLEAAEKEGWATGLVATSEVTHATPAAFAAHLVDRSDHMEIARQMAVSGVNVLFGGGMRYFQSEQRSDSLDLIQIFRDRGCSVSSALPDGDTTNPVCAVAILADDALPPASERGISLRAMTLAALRILSRDPDGFFLMVEGSQIDWAGHANDGQRLVSEMSDFNDAVRAGIDYVAGRPNTTVIVTADHETGGLTVGQDETSGRPIFNWTTTGHTAAPVSLFASGTGVVNVFGDTVANDVVGQFLLDRVNPLDQR